MALLGSPEMQPRLQPDRSPSLFKFVYSDAVIQAVKKRHEMSTQSSKQLKTGGGGGGDGLTTRLGHSLPLVETATTTTSPVPTTGLSTESTNCKLNVQIHRLPQIYSEFMEFRGHLGSGVLFTSTSSVDSLKGRGQQRRGSVCLRARRGSYAQASFVNRSQQANLARMSTLKESTSSISHLRRISALTDSTSSVTKQTVSRGNKAVSKLPPIDGE